MNNRNLELEEQVLERYLEIMNTSEVGSEEHTKALAGYKEIRDREIQEHKTQIDEAYKEEEIGIKREQLNLDKKAKKRNFILDILKVAVPVGVTVGTMVYQSTWMRNMNQFEQTGTYTYTSSKNLIKSIFNLKK